MPWISHCPLITTCILHTGIGQSPVVLYKYNVTLCSHALVHHPLQLERAQDPSTLIGNISKDVILASGGWLLILGFALPDVYYKHWMLSSVCSPDACEKNASCYSGGTQTHDLLLSSADVLTTRPSNLPVAIGWFEYIEQWVLQTIFQRWLLRQGVCYSF